MNDIQLGTIVTINPNAGGIIRATRAMVTVPDLAPGNVGVWYYTLGAPQTGWRIEGGNGTIAAFQTADLTIHRQLADLPKTSLRKLRGLLNRQQAMRSSEYEALREEMAHLIRAS